jgi:hypothetical protein
MDHVHHARGPIADYQRLRDDIAYLEARLTEIGHDGDCAYEKAMIRFFEQQLAERKAKLTN